MLVKTVTAGILSIAISISTSVPAMANDADRKVKVMTYNMYMGTDFSGVFSSQSPQELVAEVAEAYSDVAAGNPYERIDEIADQISANSPDVVGLQEVALWRIGFPGDPAPAEAVAFDFLQILLDSLAARGKHYAQVSVQSNLDAELTAVFGPGSALDVRFTDRVAIIARTDLPTSRLKVENTSAGPFQTVLPVSVLGTQIFVTRGWTSVDVKHRGKTYRFVNTHLESFFDLVQYAQAVELLQGPTNTEMPVILVGDFNSDAANNGFSYQILSSGGFADVWNITHPTAAGFTWPLSDENPSVLTAPTQRLDLILTRGALRLSGSDILGEDIGSDLTPSGFRASDHAGVVATVVLEP